MQLMIGKLFYLESALYLILRILTCSEIEISSLPPSIITPEATEIIGPTAAPTATAPPPTNTDDPMFLGKFFVLTPIL